MLSANKKNDPKDRAKWVKARHRARSYMAKIGLRATYAPDIFNVVVRLYVGKDEIDEEILKRAIERVKNDRL